MIEIGADSLDTLFGEPPATRGAGRPDNTTGYRLPDNQRVPSVTTIIGRFKDSGALIAWAYNRGRDGLPRFDDAIDVGSLVHDIVEAEIHGTEPPAIPEELRERTQSSLAAWHEWRDANPAELVATELPLVSRLHRYGGTLDCVVRDTKGRLRLRDWKSSNAIYSDYLLQLAAYAQLWDENNEETIGGFDIVRFSKEHGDFEHRFYPALENELRMFLLLRECYELDRSVRKRAA